MQVIHNTSVPCIFYKDANIILFYDLDTHIAHIQVSRLIFQLIQVNGSLLL